MKMEQGVQKVKSMWCWPDLTSAGRSLVGWTALQPRYEIHLKIISNNGYLCCQEKGDGGTINNSWFWDPFISLNGLSGCPDIQTVLGCLSVPLHPSYGAWQQPYRGRGPDISHMYRNPGNSIQGDHFHTKFQQCHGQLFDLCIPCRPIKD